MRGINELIMELNYTATLETIIKSFFQFLIDWLDDWNQSKLELIFISIGPLLEKLSLRP